MSKQSSTWIPKEGFTVTDLNAIVQEYYGNPDDVSAIGRARKMPALIMEFAIKTKTRNPNFQVILQDTFQHGHIDGKEDNPTTVNRLAILTKVSLNKSLSFFNHGEAYI